jgi:hypothetical protein
MVNFHENSCNRETKTSARVFLYVLADLLPLSSENKEHGTRQAAPRPQIIHLQRLSHVKDRKRHEHGKGNHLLEDLQLSEAEDSITCPVGRHLQHIFEKRKPPTGQHRKIPRRGAQVLQMGIPGEGHEDIGQQQ